MRVMDTLRRIASRALETITRPLARAGKLVWPPPTPRTAWQRLARGVGVRLDPPVSAVSLLDALLPRANMLPAL